MKCIPAYIYKDRTGDCSNGGISSEFSRVLIPHERGHIEVDENNPPANLCKVVKRNLFGTEYLHVEPVKKPPEGYTGYMYGGTIVDSSDSRFRDFSEYPLHLHDRTETWKEYNAMFD